MKLRGRDKRNPIRTAMTAAELDAVRKLAAGNRVLEIGSLRGASTVAMGEVAEVIHAVDPHVPYAKDGETRTMLTQFAANLIDHGLFEKVVFHVAWSSQIVPLFPDRFFDLAFVDAAHQYDAVAEDLRLVRRVVKPDGVLAFHDYGIPGTARGDEWHPFGVTEVVDGFVAETGAGLEIVDTLAIVRL